MHRSLLKTFGNSIGLVLAMVALLRAAPTLACPESIFPPIADTELLIAPERVPQLLAKIPVSEGCVALTADLAQLYYWGVGQQAADLDQAAHYLRALQRLAPADAVLRLLEPALVLLGKIDRYSREEALRRYQREIDSGDPLRRDKALAVLNQLGQILPGVSLTGQALYLEGARISLAPAAERGVILDQPAGLLLVESPSAAPQLRWVSAPARLPPLQGTVAFYAREPSAVDARRQQWQLPSDALSTGLVRVGFGQGNQFREIQCTATVVAPRWLLTAAHCLSPPTDVAPAPLQGLAFEWRGERWVIDQVWRHRQHRASDQQRGDVAKYSGSDIALLELAVPLPLDHFPELRSPADTVEVFSFGYPDDKARGTLWGSQCRGRAHLAAGEAQQGEVYRLNCSNSVGQSGSAVVDRDRPGAIYGVLSARVRQDGDDFNVFAALRPALISDIQQLIGVRPAGQPAPASSRFFTRCCTVPALLSRN